MNRSALRLFFVMIAGFALIGAAGSTVSAQDAAVSHPSHIHAGTCAELDPNPAFPLSNVEPVAPDAAEGSVETGMSTVDVSLDDILASPHAINVHESAENAANYIACGDLTGPVVDGKLVVGLIEQNDSGYAGIAVLESSYGGGTDVSVYLATGLSGDSAGASSVADNATSDEVAVSIVDFAFDAQVIEIPVGTTVTWTNQDSAPHTTTANDGTWDSAVLEQGDSFSFTFDTAGTFDYICNIHPSMTGQVVVTEP